MGDRFTVTTERVNKITVLAVHGAADLATVPDFAAHLWRAVDAGEECILIDLAEAVFIDSRMVELLLQAAERVRRQEGQLAICCAGEEIRQVLDLCGVTRVLPVRPSRDEAFAVLTA
ncbi:MAG: anti-sigma factor antagonist [Thermoleophilaceae bacterium]|jgi:anti-anti-sigma factor|nr:anti-sigma factor antagonist [Thermoleophilaceae bacterium]